MSGLFSTPKPPKMPAPTPPPPVPTVDVARESTMERDRLRRRRGRASTILAGDRATTLGAPSVTGTPVP